MKMFFLVAAVVCCQLTGLSQADSTAAPYTRFPQLPPFKILLTDSATYFTKDMLEKKRPILFMLFSPDCEHCQHETEDIIGNMELLGKIQVLMVTTAPFDKMSGFYTKYDLKRFPNIIVGRDIGYFFPVFYDVRNLPFMAFYNKKQSLISVYRGAMPIDRVIDEIQK
jgi:thiol-disulfide isomerase/thioredoxin